MCRRSQVRCESTTTAAHRSWCRDCSCRDGPLGQQQFVLGAVARWTDGERRRIEAGGLLGRDRELAGPSVTFTVAVSPGGMGPAVRVRRGPSIVMVWAAPDWLAISSVTGPAPNLAGEAVIRSGPIRTDMLIGTGGRSWLRASSSPPQPATASASAASIASSAARRSRACDFDLRVSISSSSSERRTLSEKDAPNRLRPTNPAQPNQTDRRCPSIPFSASWIRARMSSATCCTNATSSAASGPWRSKRTGSRKRMLELRGHVHARRPAARSAGRRG